MAKQESESQRKARIAREIAGIAHDDGDDIEFPGLYGAMMSELLSSEKNKTSKQSKFQGPEIIVIDNT
jgi:hypothetical protein